MITEVQQPTLTSPRATPSKVSRPGRDLAVGALPAAALAAATCWLLGVPTSVVAETLVLYGALAALVMRGLPAILVGPGIGAANRVTLGRGILVTPIAALVLHPGMLVLQGTYWWIVLLAGGAMALDFVDGKVARSTGTSSAFGARFDMEVDAFLLMVLSVLVWQSGKAGAWVLGIGALRYLFVGTALVWPALNGELPHSMRRKTVCVVQGASLIFALLPFVPAEAAMVVAASALASLVWSFAVDVRWLAAHPPQVS
jgi:phosphatidylglycerophosphate synthase